MLSKKESDYLTLVNLLYETVVDQGQWTEFLRVASEWMASPSGGLHAHDLMGGTPAGGWHSGCDPAAMEQYDSYYGAVNPWMPKGDPVPTGTWVITTDSFLPLEQLRRTEFYNDWGRRNGVVHSLGLMVGIAAGRFTYLSFNRSEEQGEHSPEAIELATRLVPHVRRAVGWAGDLQRSTALDAAIDRSPRALVFVDSRGRIRGMTSAAESLLARRDGLYRERGVLRGLSSAVNDRLEQCIREAAQAATIETAPSEGFLLVPRKDPYRREMILFFAAVRPSRVNSLKDGWIAIDIVDPEAPPNLGQARVAKVFGLSTKEAELLAALLETGDLKKAAEMLNKGYETAKTQLKSIFLKTRTTGQSELAGLVALLNRAV